MELIKRKISLESVIDRKDGTVDEPNKSWGVISTASTLYVNIFLTQTIDDMSIFEDTEYLPKSRTSNQPNYDVLIDKLNSLGGEPFSFMLGYKPTFNYPLTPTEIKTLRLPNSTVSDYHVKGNEKLTGFTDSKLEDVKTYTQVNPYQVGFNIKTEEYINYDGVKITGVTRVTSNGIPKIYVFDTKDDTNIGTDNQIYGLQYLDYTGDTREVVIDNIRSTIPTTIVKYIGEGWNDTNTSLSALTQEEYLFGIVSRPEVQNDVFIDRGVTNVLDLHLRLSEIGNMGELMRYGNGYYNINKQ